MYDHDKKNDGATRAVRARMLARSPHQSAKFYARDGRPWIRVTSEHDPTFLLERPATETDHAR